MRHVRSVVFALSLVLGVAACGGDEPVPPAQPTPGATESTAGGPAPDLAWYDAEEMAAAGEDTGVVWLVGWFVPEALDGVTAADLEARYRKALGLAPEAGAEKRARAAFAALADPGPVDLLNPLEGVALRLTSGRVEDRGGVPTAVLGFDGGINATNELGGYAADAETQFHAMVAEYFPDAVQVVVTVDGAPGSLFGGKPYGEPVSLAR